MTEQKRAFQLQDLTQQCGKDAAGKALRIWSATFDLPGEKVNKLSRSAMGDFEDLLQKLEALAAKGEIDALVVLSGKAGNFIAGADIEMIQAARSEAEAEGLSRMGQRLLDRWEDLPFPTVAAVNGAALGGGLEVCLGCTALVISNDPVARIGLPEVMLGLIPGMGGCVRLPRRVGLATALDLILTGKMLDGARAYRSGIADALLQKEDFDRSALRWTAKNLESLRAGRRLGKEPKLGGTGGVVGAALEKTALGRSVILRKAREGVLSKTKGQYPSPLEALDVIQATGGRYGSRLKGAARDRAMEREARGFGRLAVTDVSKNLVRLFFLTEKVKKSQGISQDSEASAGEIRHAAVLGAGVMGGGIAQLLADKGVPNRMKDLNPQALSLGMKSAAAVFQKKLKRRRMDKREYLQKMNLIAPVLDYAGFKSTDLVIEAIIEKMDIKKSVLAELEGNIPENCVVATNTSSLSVTEMQSALKKPERFVGMHFFNPVHRMPLVEVIRGEKSSDQAVSTVFQFSKRIGKTPIVVKDAPGFLVNRLLMPYLNEATWMLSEGVPVEELDSALLSFGMPMGPMELIDEVGVDVGDKVAHILHDAFGSRMEPAPLQGKVAESGRLGKKAGKGVYLYSEGGRKKSLDPEVYSLLGITPRPKQLSPDEIVERCVLPMINEATRCLAEGVVESAEEVDLGMIMGTGFPPFRGGLLRYADRIGAQAVVDRLRVYEKRYGARYAPAPQLIEMARQGNAFHS